jgi:WD40 repeat protein
VADWSAGAVPGPLARLAEGGLTMRKTLLFGALLAVTVGGVVFAARPDESPPVDPPKPLVAQKPAAAPQPKEEPKPGDKAVTYTNAPRMRLATDIRIGGVSAATWSADGKFFALQGNKPSPTVAVLAILKDRTEQIGAWNSDGIGDLVGFAPDSRALITGKREYHLVSGFHWLRFESMPDDIEKALKEGYRPMERKVNLDLPETRGYAFAPDGKTYRTVALHREAAGAATRLEVLEVDAAAGKAAKSLLKLDYGQYALSANGKRLAVLDKDATKVTVYDLDRGAKQSEHTFPADGDAGLPRVSEKRILVISPDGRRLFVSRGPGRSHLLDADNGTPLLLEGVKHSGVYPADSAFTGDGRLFASRGTIYTPATTRVGGKEETAWSQNGSFLTVWDTRTGKALKTWNQSPRVLFHPTQPILATLEGHGDNQTRLGFWDFAAEVGKK